MKPKKPVYLDLLGNLHKKSDYEQQWRKIIQKNSERILSIDNDKSAI